MRFANRRGRFTFAAVLMCWFAGVSSLLAEDLRSAPLIKQGDETLILNVGGIVNSFGTSVQLNGQSHNGTDISLEGNGLKKTEWSFQGAATWRFTSRNRVDPFLHTSAVGADGLQTGRTAGRGGNTSRPNDRGRQARGPCAQTRAAAGAHQRGER